MTLTDSFGRFSQDFEASISHLSSAPDPPLFYIPQDTLPDPNDDADFELPDQDALFHAFLAGL